MFFVIDGLNVNELNVATELVLTFDFFAAKEAVHKQNKIKPKAIVLGILAAPKPFLNFIIPFILKAI